MGLSNSSIAENEPPGTAVGTLTMSYPPLGPFTFALVAGADDNASFTIIGDVLYAAESFDFETKSTYIARVRATAAQGFTFEEAFTITVANVADPTN